jgi:hypothetical protein
MFSTFLYIPLENISKSFPQMVTVMNENSNDDTDNVQQNVSEEEKISTARMVNLTELICGMEERSFISEQQIMSVYKIKDQLLEKDQNI